MLGAQGHDRTLEFSDVGQRAQAAGQLCIPPHQFAKAREGLPRPPRLQCRSARQPLVDSLQQPVIGLTIQHQVNALARSRVIHTVRTRQVEEPALAGVHGHLQAIDEELHPRQAQQRHMQAQVAARQA
ncbi:hypothetical protein D9M71_358100 [compost metagenome]